MRLCSDYRCHRGTRRRRLRRRGRRLSRWDGRVVGSQEVAEGIIVERISLQGSVRLWCCQRVYVRANAGDITMCGLVHQHCGQDTPLPCRDACTSQGKAHQPSSMTRSRHRPVQKDPAPQKRRRPQQRDPPLATPRQMGLAGAALVPEHWPAQWPQREMPHLLPQALRKDRRKVRQQQRPRPEMGDQAKAAWPPRPAGASATGIDARGA